MYLSEWYGRVIRKVYANASVRTMAGAVGMAGSADGIGTEARFNGPNQLAYDNTGPYVYVADYSNNLIRRVIVSRG